MAGGFSLMPTKLVETTQGLKNLCQFAPTDITYNP